MKIISIVFLTVLAVERTHSLTSHECIKYVQQEKAIVRASFEACADNLRHEVHCEAKCAFELQQATVNGVLTLQSFSTLIRTRVVPEICDAVETNMAECFRNTAPDGEAVYPNSPCYEWDAMYRCWLYSLNMLEQYKCNDFPSSRRSYWGK
ncbi:unnamed protein product [Allacma fusca]|uniref:Uncharacterized protein n=1 Tax=Allacma fusca TaxID=39272 RepID=A0A8J2PCQ0_9HEXA|nr:unnamed protein product [Allacma fusca]